MSKLYRDVLYLIFQETCALPLYLTVNKTWCEIIIPIIWKNPWEYLKKGKEGLRNNFTFIR